MKSPSGDSRSQRLLIVDDEEFVSEAIELFFASEGFEVFTANNGTLALEIVEHESIDVALLDILMPEMDGIELLEQIKQRDPQIEVIMVTGCGTLESAIEAIRLGAYDYVTKPITNFDEDLLKVVRKACERQALLRDNRALAGDLKEINRELKHSNSALKRHLADLEVLYETSHMLGELEDLDSLLDVALQTVQHTFQSPLTLILLEEQQAWQVYRATPGATDSATESLWQPEPELLQQITNSNDGNELLPANWPSLSHFLGEIGVTQLAEHKALVVPLRTTAECHGLILSLQPQSYTWSEDRVRLLRAFAAQLSAPVAICRERVDE